MLYRALLVTKSAYLVQEYPLLMRSYRMTKVRLWNTSFYIPTLGAQMIYLADFKPQLFSFFRGKLEIIKDCECGLLVYFSAFYVSRQVHQNCIAQQSGSLIENFFLFLKA